EGVTALLKLLASSHKNRKSGSRTALPQQRRPLQLEMDRNSRSTACRFSESATRPSLSQRSPWAESQDLAVIRIGQRINVSIGPRPHVADTRIQFPEQYLLLCPIPIPDLYPANRFLCKRAHKKVSRPLWKFFSKIECESRGRDRRRPHNNGIGDTRRFL